MSDRRSCVRLTGQGRGKQPLNNCYCARAPPETFKRDSWGCAAAQPSPAQPSPAQPSPAQPSPRRRQAQALARGERLRPRQEARAQDYGKILSGRWLTNAAGMAGRGAGVEGMGCVTAGPALVGLCCTQETTSGAVPAQQYANCSKEPTVKVSASSPYSLSSARAGSLQ
jgi:hypothetical protein